MADAWDKKLKMEGRRFGKWEVIKLIETDKPGKHYECMCKCGTIKIIPGTTLRAGRSTQCPACQYATLYNRNVLIGKRFGHWTIVEFIDIHRGLQRYETVCDCGTKSKHCVAELRAKNSQMCVICHNRANAQANTKHGKHNALIYKIWSAIIQRCENPKSTGYKYYGGRGIKVCERWHKFENFYADMGERPDSMTIDRIDNNGNYEPSNCRWVTHKENCNNRYY